MNTSKKNTSIIPFNTTEMETQEENSAQLTEEQKFSKYMAEIQKDALDDIAWNKAEMLNSAFDSTIKKAKWINRKLLWQNRIRGLEKQRKITLRKRYEFYKTDYKFTISNNTDFKMVLDTDSELIEIDEKMDESKMAIKYIEDVLETLKSRAFEVQYYHHHFVFLNGGDSKSNK